MRALFITGGTGFIGRQLLRSIDPANFRSVTCLSREERPAAPEPGAAIRFVRGDLGDPSSYARDLAGCDTVLHLGAATGRAPRDASLSVNVDGTRALIRECQRQGVRDFLLASTIAVKYPNVREYPYAESKQLAEAALTETSLRYAIIRPTIVVGLDAPIWQALAGLAGRRVIVMPGSGRVRVQPIFVNDLISVVLTLLERDLFERSVFELGGPEVASFDEFLRRIHRLRFKREPAIVHLPLGPIMALLSRVNPVAAGQLSAFRYDSTIDPALSFHDASVRALGLDDMIRACLPHV
jgi:nucleoside-diphosphate-sugar epimerase